MKSLKKRDLFNEEVNKDESILFNKSINIAFGHLLKWMLFALRKYLNHCNATSDKGLLSFDIKFHM